MPNRYVREGILSSHRVNALSLGAEVFYRRLMSVADDHGRYHGSVVTLRGACFPLNPEKISEKEISKWLTELIKGDNPLVKMYSIDGATYLEIQNFGQTTRSKSKFPNPPWHNICITNAEQMQSDCKANAEQMNATAMPISRTRTRTRTDATSAAQQPQTQPAMQVSFGDVPKLGSMIRQKFKTADAIFVSKVANAMMQEWVSQTKPKIPAPNDEEMAAAVTEALRGANHTGPGLLLKTGPAVIANWCIYGRDAPGLPPPKRWIEPTLPEGSE